MVAPLDDITNLSAHNVLAEVDELLDRNFRTSAQAAHDRILRETIVLKTTPIAEPAPRRQLPPCTPITSAALAHAINSPEGRELLHALSKRTREIFVTALATVLTKAPVLGGWSFDIKTRDLGKLLGKSHTNANCNFHKLDRVSLVNYRHAATQAETGDAPSMHVDLTPIICKLLDVTGVSDVVNVTELTITTSCNVYETFAGDGEFSDATMRANPMTKDLHGRTLRPLNAGALNGLDLVARGELAITRRQLVDELGMSPGSAAGATRIWLEVGIVTVEKNGRSNEYVFSPDWREQLEALVPKMVSFLASNRLEIGNVSDRIVEVERKIRQLGGDPKQMREDDPQPVRDLHTRHKKMVFARKCLIKEMEAKDLANRPDATPVTSVVPGGWVPAPRLRSAQPVTKRKPSRHISEGETLTMRQHLDLALVAAAQKTMGVAA